MPAVDPPDLSATFRHAPSGPRIVLGVGAVAGLAGELDLLGARRALLVAKRSSAALDPVAGRLAGHFAGVRQHVPAATARAAAMARDTGADALRCLGGGSATGTAKAVALETGLPIVAVPLTYAGSEVTPVYGLTENAVKCIGRSPLVVPKTVLYDPASPPACRSGSARAARSTPSRTA